MQELMIYVTMQGEVLTMKIISDKRDLRVRQFLRTGTNANFQIAGLVYLILEIAITTQTPPHVSWEYKLDCVVHKFISLIYTTVFDMMLFF